MKLLIYEEIDKSLYANFICRLHDAHIMSTLASVIS